MRPPCCTEHLLELTETVHEVLAANRITHWLDYGTLLGAVREEAFIAWDADVDISVMEADVPAILALAPELAEAGHQLDAEATGMIRINYSPINTQHVELIIWKEEDGLLRTDANEEYNWPGLHGRNSFPRRYVEGLETVRLYGRPYPAPSPVHDFLVEHRYGPDYMVPARPIGRVWLYPDIEPSEMSPRVNSLLAELSEKDERLSEATTRWRLARTKMWGQCQGEVLPAAPRPEAVSGVLAGIPAAERSQAVEELARSVAWLDLALESVENPKLASRLRRTLRMSRCMLRRTLLRMVGIRQA